MSPRERRDRRDLLRYYIYVSDTKVDMLLGQIPPRLLKRIAAEVTVDLKLLSLKVATRDAPDTRFSRVAVVSRFLESSGEVCRLDALPCAYIEVEAMPMRWGLLGSGTTTPGLVLFASAGSHRAVRIYLTGSPAHVLGVAPRGEPLYEGGHPGSFLQTLQPYAARLAEVEEGGRVGPGVVGQASALASKLIGPTETISFLARVLHHESGTVIGTPIWAAQVAPEG